MMYWCMDFTGKNVEQNLSIPPIIEEFFLKLIFLLKFAEKNSKFTEKISKF